MPIRYTKNDFSFMPVELGEVTAKIINDVPKAATHTTRNKGTWDIAKPDENRMEKTAAALWRTLDGQRK